VRLNARQSRHYQLLRREYLKNGAVVATASLILVDAAKVGADLEEAEEAAASAPMLASATAGQEYQHPLRRVVADLRKQMASYHDRLLLAPRAKSSARIAAKTLDQSASLDWRSQIDALCASDDDGEDGVAAARIIKLNEATG
jgi:hypothetical protein